MPRVDSPHRLALSNIFVQSYSANIKITIKPVVQL